MKIECCDNLDLMRTLSTETIDLIYCDILYGTGRNFGDYQDLKCDRKVIEEHYIPRITEMYKMLKKTGSIYLQMDTRINHWVRCIMDDIFGYKNFRNEIVWCYRSAGFNRKKWSEKHDVILFYSKDEHFKFNLENVREKDISESTQKRFHKEISKYGKIPNKKNGKIYWHSPYSSPRDWFIISSLPHLHSERIGYNTQKPEALIERIIKASSNESDTVADFYMGSGTTAVVCKKLNRNFIGCDINQNAVDLTNKRLNDVGEILF